MLMQLPNEEALVLAGNVEYCIPADWTGGHTIVSTCGWWVGSVYIVDIDGARHIEWLKAYSIRFDD